MSILVTGSVAFDHIMVFEDQFKNHILPDKVHVLNVAFLVPSLDKRWGGTAANIGYNLRIVEEDPIVLATAGRDFGPYLERFRECGLRTEGVKMFDDELTAQAFITTDLDDNQITAFHPGAMERAHEWTIGQLPGGAAEAVSVGIVAPNGKQAMVDHANALKGAGKLCVVDPGQGLPLFDGPELLALLDGAGVYIVNDYEWALTLDKTGQSEEAIAERVGAVIVTRGGEGSTLIRGGTGTVAMASDRCDIATVKPEAVVDPTGCGDSYRAGLLHALHRGKTLETGARIGSLFGALKIARHGPQSIPSTRRPSASATNASTAKCSDVVRRGRRARRGPRAPAPARSRRGSPSRMALPVPWIIAESPSAGSASHPRRDRRGSRVARDPGCRLHVVVVVRGGRARHPAGGRAARDSRSSECCPEYAVDLTFAWKRGARIRDWAPYADREHDGCRTGC